MEAIDQPGRAGPRHEERDAHAAREAREHLVHQAELMISYVLRGGVLLSALIILVGLVSFYLVYGSSGQRTAHDTSYPHSLAALGQGLAHTDPLSVVTLGLIVLLATPVVRVAVSIVAFGLERDWRYVAITTTVLVILVASFLLGKGGA
jgi:uncharacterized membrane protein